MLAHDILKKDVRSFAPNSIRATFYLVLLIVSKLFRCIGVFIISILAKSIHVVGLLWLLKLGTALMLVPVQKPLTHGKSLKKPLLVKIGQLSVFNSIIEVFWFYGITFCGPLRSILVFEQSSTVMLAAILALTKGGGSPSKIRGSLVLLVGFLSLFLLDRDISVEHQHSEMHGHHSGLNRLFYHALNWSGVADHRGGLCLLLLALLMRIGYDSLFRRLSVQVGGCKRLYSLVTLNSCLLLSPVALITLFTQETPEHSYIYFFSLLPFACTFVHVFDLYADSACSQHQPEESAGCTVVRWSPILSFLWSLSIAFLWFHLSDSAQVTEHDISGGVIVTLVCFSAASIILTAPNRPRARAGHFVGFSDSGLPLYAYGDDFLQRTSRSVLLFIKETMREILSSSDSRHSCHPHFFPTFCGVEFLYGFWTNSLGLLSDGFHMLFDCSALVMGLVASVMSRWAVSRLFSYGYGRVEVLSGFINALFLVVIAFFIFLEAFERLYDPPEVHTEKLLFVSVAGLLVNLFGLYAFHGNGGNHGHGHGHGHSHGGTNANMQGVFLHVMADTLGSVFVIISSLLIEHLGWLWVDPFCSLILALLIFSSVVPLLRASAATLLQCVPPEVQHQFVDTLAKINEQEGVVSYSQPHLWQLKSDVNVISVHVQVDDDANAQAVRQVIIQLLSTNQMASITSVQVEKTVFFDRIATLCPSFPIVISQHRSISMHNSAPIPALINGDTRTSPDSSSENRRFS